MTELKLSRRMKIIEKELMTEDETKAVFQLLVPSKKVPLKAGEGT